VLCFWADDMVILVTEMPHMTAYVLWAWIMYTLVDSVLVFWAMLICDAHFSFTPGAGNLPVASQQLPYCSKACTA
jgi:hypothetical protein